MAEIGSAAAERARDAGDESTPPHDGREKRSEWQREGIPEQRVGRHAEPIGQKAERPSAHAGVLSALDPVEGGPRKAAPERQRGL